jgi:hypothetical protein
MGILVYTRYFFFCIFRQRISLAGRASTCSGNTGLSYVSWNSRMSVNWEGSGVALHKEGLLALDFPSGIKKYNENTRSRDSTSTDLNPGLPGRKYSTRC